MKTSIELDEKKVKLARSLSDANTLRELIDQALDSLIAQQRRNSISNVLGSGLISGSTSQMRGRTRAGHS